MLEYSSLYSSVIFRESGASREFPLNDPAA